MGWQNNTAVALLSSSRLEPVAIATDLEEQMGSRQTSKRVASQAGKVLKDPNATAPEKSAAASALTQYKSQKEETGKVAASKASEVLRDPRATDAEKSAAASALSQRRK